MPTILERPIYLAADLSPETPVQSDGTMWSHAATLGTYFKGASFSIDKATIENCIQVFKTGFPQKICVDYEHGTVNGAADLGQPVPAAGQVMELKGVYAVEDLTGDLLATAKKLAEKVGRSLSDSRNFGLWMRWRPTARALQMVTAREYTEISIVLFDDMTHNVTGEGQGPAIFSVALTNTPFIDAMLPVAASRDIDRGTSTDLDERRQRNMPNPTMLQRAAAFFGKAFSTEEEVQAAAENEITTLRRENESLKPFKAYHDAISPEVAEPDPVKAASKIRELKATVTAAQKAQEEEKEKAMNSEADKILLKHEKRLSPAQKDYFRPQLVTELKAGTKSGETKTEKVIESFPENKALGRTSAADGGKDAPTDRDARLQLRAHELMESDPSIKRQAEKDEYGAYKRALSAAGREIPRDEDKK